MLFFTHTHAHMHHSAQTVLPGKSKIGNRGIKTLVQILFDHLKIEKPRFSENKILILTQGSDQSHAQLYETQTVIDPYMRND